MLFLHSLVPGRRHQATRVVESMGGKGCDVSLILRALGEETLALGVAGGQTGEKMEARLRDCGVETQFVWVDGESRLNTVLIETETLRHTTLCAEGLCPSRGAFYDLLAEVRREAATADAVAVCGSLPAAWPPEYYEELVRSAASGGRPVVVDAAGQELLAAARARPAAVKPNIQELESVSGGSLRDRQSIAAAARALVERGVGIVLASLGPEGAVLLTEEEGWCAPPVHVDVVNPAGSGDGMVAMLALGLGRGWPAEEILRQAVAVASAIATTPGTAECPAERVPELLARVRLEHL